MLSRVTGVDALRALEDVRRNDGMMWEPRSGEAAKVLWDELRRRGWVRGNAITAEGLHALKDANA